MIFKYFIFIIYLVYNVNSQKCSDVKLYSFIEVPIVLVTSSDNLDHLKEIIGRVEYYNAENEGIIVNLKVMKIIDTSKIYNSILDDDLTTTSSYIHIFYKDKYDEEHNNFVRRSGESLNRYIKFKSYVNIKKTALKDRLERSNLDYALYDVEHDKDDFIIMYERKKYDRKKSVAIFGTEVLFDDIVSNINYVITSYVENLGNINKEMYNDEVYSIYDENGKNKFGDDTDVDDQIKEGEETAYDRDEFVIVSCQTNPKNKRHCCHDSNKFDGSYKYKLHTSLKSNNYRFTIVEITGNDDHDNDIQSNIDGTFIIPQRYIHFRVKYECKNLKESTCNDMDQMMKNTIDGLNKYIYNIKFSYEKVEDDNYNLLLKMATLSSLKGAAETTQFDVFGSSKIIVTIGEHDKETTITPLEKHVILTLHGIICHALGIEHENGQVYTQFTSAVDTGLTHCEKYFVFRDINKAFEIYVKEQNAVKRLTCEHLMNTETTAIHKCTNKTHIYYKFSFLIGHTRTDIEDVNMRMFNDVTNEDKRTKLKAYKSLPDAIDNLQMNLMENLDIASVEYEGYVHRTVDNFKNSKCTSVTQVKINEKVYYVNLGNYESVLFDELDNHVTCCINGILCSDLKNHKQIPIEDYYRGVYTYKIISDKYDKMFSKIMIKEREKEENKNKKRNHVNDRTQDFDGGQWTNLCGDFYSNNVISSNSYRPPKFIKRSRIPRYNNYVYDYDYQYNYGYNIW